MKESKQLFLVYENTFNHLGDRNYFIKEKQSIIKEKVKQMVYDDNIKCVNVFNKDNDLIIGFEKKL